MSGTFFFDGSPELFHSFLKVGIPILTAAILWAVSVPMQTAILGHLSSDAIAANSVSTTFYQYLKVIVSALASASVHVPADAGSHGTGRSLYDHHERRHDRYVLSDAGCHRDYPGIRRCKILPVISTWVIVMPLSFLSAFVWKWPVELVVVAVQCDQLFKCIPIFLRFKSYRWIHHLTD